MKLNARKRPCRTCPWRTDTPPGRFPPEAFIRLAPSSYDMNRMIFQCHDTSDERPVVCAGFLARGALHNLTVRLAAHTDDLEQRDRSGGAPLHADYRAMAIANGVDADDPALMACRGNEYRQNE